MMSAPRALMAAFWMVGRWTLAGVFIYAGFVKTREAEAFAASIARFQLVPTALIHPLALGLPLFEMLCGIALLAGPWKRQAAFSIALLCTLFLIALVSAGVRGIAIECTCFGAPQPESLWQSIVRDLVLLLVAVVFYVRTSRKRHSIATKLSTQRVALNGTY